MSKILSCILLLASCPAFAQFTYNIDQDVPVLQEGAVLSNAWSGGLNSPQFNTMDINNDGEQDLVIFDRASAKLSPFLSVDGEYLYAPEFEANFPPGISNWFLLRDFNCDGKKDIFTSDPRGVVVYVNTTESGGVLQWRAFNFRESQGLSHLLTQGFSSIINLQINGSDLPAITDIDNDGDLDILTYRFSGASTVEFHKNLSMERDGNCDSLQYERVTQKWGEFEECECGTFALNGADCPPNSGGREEHQGGKSMLTLDLDGDQVQEVLVSEEQCVGLFALDNSGTLDNALISAVDNNFPNVNNPAQLFVFPAAYSEDVDFDGIDDLLVAPNVPGNVGASVNFQSSSWLYKNTGTSQSPEYTLVQRNFLQDQMIDLGENAAPALADLDGDGDLDMIVGNYVNLEEFGFRAGLTYYENIGSASSPSFERVTTDYLSLSVLGLVNLKPRFRDVNADGNDDLVYSASSINSGSTDIYYFLNKSETGYEFDLQSTNILFNLSTSFSNNDNYELTDITGDGLLDLLIGRSSGRLEYYKHIGSGEAPDFELEDPSFYGLDFTLFRQSPSASVSDFDGDGKKDLIVGDARGNLTLFNDFLETLENPESGVTKLFRDDNGDSLALAVGNKLMPVAADLFNANRPAIVVGTGTGGLVLLKHTDTNSVPISPNDGVLTLTPNPVQQHETLQISTTEEITLSITTIAGKTIYKGLTVEANGTISIGMSSFRSGLYLVVGKNKNRTEVARFIVVE